MAGFPWRERILGVYPVIKFSDFLQHRQYQFWALQLVGWTGWVILFAIRDTYWGQPTERILLLLSDAATGLVLTTLLRHIYRAVWDWPVYQRIIAVLVASYVMAAIWQPIKNYSQFAYYPESDLFMEYGMAAYFSGILGYSWFLLLGWSGLYFALKYYRLLQEAIEKSIRAQSLAQESQLRMLRYQLNPHFLFNTLNAISTLILAGDTDKASAMVSKLGHFLRYTLGADLGSTDLNNADLNNPDLNNPDPDNTDLAGHDSAQGDPGHKVELHREINTTKLYLEIEQVRFGDRLQIELCVAENANQALVPILILQPLVENSIKHAVANREHGGRITIKASRFADDLHLEVIDDGPGIPLEQRQQPVFGGVGLANTQERLLQLYGNKHACTFKQAIPRGLKVEIRLPFETRQDSE